LILQYSWLLLYVNIESFQFCEQRKNGKDLREVLVFNYIQLIL
jgi:hypothetical protein